MCRLRLCDLSIDGGHDILKPPPQTHTHTQFLPDSLIFPSRLSRWFASFTAAWFSLRLLQSKHSDAYTEVTTVRDTASKSGGPRQKVTRYAGRTLDLTLFAACRAVDVVVGELWAQRRERRTAAGKWTWVST